MDSICLKREIHSLTVLAGSDPIFYGERTRNGGATLNSMAQDPKEGQQMNAVQHQTGARVATHQSRRDRTSRRSGQVAAGRS
jgi:hypothetical protein